MTERPIIFSGPMVRATLEGRKTQTRRVVKPQPRSVGDHFSTRQHGTAMIRPPGGDSWEPVRCPYGQPGDRLWVRETWKYHDWTEDGIPFICYAATADMCSLKEHPEEWAERVTDVWAELSLPENVSKDGRASDRRWRPSIHMPRWASRLTLEVTAVRVERLQEISEEDAKAEGYESAESFLAGDWAKSKVDTNPWVWVVEFRKVEP